MSYKAAFDERNARLVEIGVGVLRADSEKERQVIAARKWAIDLIEGNAGGIKFSNEATDALEKNSIGFSNFSIGAEYGYQPGNFRPDLPSTQRRAQ